jgi:hypothetical protein
LVKPTNWKRKLLNRLGANITAIPLDYLFTALPLSIGWSHEEYHRTTMTQRGISSYNDFWSLAGLKSLSVAVSRAKDEDLVWFKANHPAEIVRMNSAGTEAEYVFIQAMQKDNFFHQTNYPNTALSILLTMYYSPFGDPVITGV